MSTLPFDPKAFLARAAEGQTLETYQAREVIFAQGEPACAVYYIVAGRVKRTVVSHQGKVVVVALLGPGEFFGEGCMTGMTPRMASAVAMEECTIGRLEKPVAVRMLHDEPAFAEMFIAFLLTRNLRMEADLVDHLFNSSEKRLARLLVILSNFDEEGKVEVTIPKISQQTLAEMIGTTRARISFFMNKFRRLGLIDYNKHITVNRSLLNVILSDWA